MNRTNLRTKKPLLWATAGGVVLVRGIAPRGFIASAVYTVKKNCTMGCVWFIAWVLALNQTFQNRIVNFTATFGPHVEVGSRKKETVIS